MHLHIYRSFSELDSLANEWNDLLSHSASHVPFLRYEYLKNWWQTLGGGEWTHGQLFVVAGRNPEGKLAAVAPMFQTENRDGEPALMLLGSIEICDYLDILACPDDLSTFTPALFDLLSSPQAPQWQVLDWYNLLAASPTIPALKTSSQQCGWGFEQEVLQPCPRIDLPGSWDAYLAGLDKKQRHEIRRKMRRAEAGPVAIRWRIVTGGSGLDADIDEFFRLMAYDEEKGRFLTESMRAQMRSTAHLAASGGWLQLAFLEVDGQNAAAYFNFDDDNRIWVYNSGMDPAFRDLSPGWVLLSYLLKWANDHQRESFDFMRGNEDYKYRFGAADRFVTRIKVRRS